jgi:hypothetical protein
MGKGPAAKADWARLQVCWRAWLQPGCLPTFGSGMQRWQKKEDNRQPCATWLPLQRVIVRPAHDLAPLQSGSLDYGGTAYEFQVLHTLYLYNHQHHQARSSPNAFCTSPGMPNPLTNRRL